MPVPETVWTGLGDATGTTGGTAGTGTGAGAGATVGAEVGAGAGLAVAEGRGLVDAVGWQGPSGSSSTGAQESAAAGAAMANVERESAAKAPSRTAVIEPGKLLRNVISGSVRPLALNGDGRQEEQRQRELDRIDAHGLVEQFVNRSLPFQLGRGREVHTKTLCEHALLRPL